MLDILKALARLNWVHFTWAVNGWLSNPGEVTLTLLVFIAVITLFSRRRYRRRMVTLGLTFLGLYWLLMSPLFYAPANYLLGRFVPEDSGQHADAIVVLYRDQEILGDRYQTAIDLIEQGRADQLLVMNRNPGPNVVTKLEQQRLSTSVLLNAVCVRTTKDEALSAVVALGTQGLSKIILITDSSHMLRSWLTFRGLGFTVIPYAEPLPDSLPYYKRSLVALREYLGLMSYAILGRFEDRPASALPQFAESMLVRYPLDSCFKTAEQIRQSPLSS